jgi:hypothetical protein
LSKLREALFYAISFTVHLDAQATGRKKVLGLFLFPSTDISEVFYSNNNTLNQFNAAGVHMDTFPPLFSVD